MRLVSSSYLQYLTANFCTIPGKTESLFRDEAEVIFIEHVENIRTILLPRPISNDPRFIQYICHYSHASKAFCGSIIVPLCTLNVITSEIVINALYFPLV